MILERRVCAHRSRDGGGNEKAFLNKAGSLSAGRSHAYTQRLIVTSCDGDRHCKHRDRPSALSPDPGCTGAESPLLFPLRMGTLQRDRDILMRWGSHLL